MTFPHKMLRDLKPNWNSYGAPAIDERCIQKAYELWRQLAGEWQVVPCTDGGVQLEQHRDGFDIEITVSSAEKATSPAPRGKPCTCSDTTKSACGVEQGGVIGELWHCRRAAENRR